MGDRKQARDEEFQSFVIGRNETATVVERAAAGTATDVPAIRSPKGSPYDWFVCLAPKGAEYKTAEVIG
jgi:hypothetical protein